MLRLVSNSVAWVGKSPLSAFQLKFRRGQAALPGKHCVIAVGGDHQFQSPRRLATQHDVAQMNASQHRRLFEGPGSMSVKLQIAGESQPRIFGLRKVSQVEAGAIHIGQELVALQVVRPIPHHSPPVHQQGGVSQVDVLPG